MATRTDSRSPAQTFALVFGAVYLLVGVAGFFVTGFDGPAASTFDEKLVVFPLNPLHNVVHLLLGAVWLGAAGKHQTAKAVNLGLGAAYLLVFVLGLLGALEWLAIPSGLSADDGLHLVSGAAALYFGTAGAETAGGAATQTARKAPATRNRPS